ncbi:PPOX class F420-dependent oxidoreductase [Streptomyces sp. NPDC051561]|uniref:PPOX class F420-dependent oxidoreductase n=1 Tax=Streptomyces sp. NPDC051561 TaxID=3365658 RepID=UPI0037B836AF
MTPSPTSTPTSAQAPTLTPEVRARIEAPNFWYVATVDADGAPHVTPMWLDLEGEHLLFNTSVGRIKERNLRRDPRLYLSHADAENPYDRIQIRGRAVGFVEGPEAELTMDRLAKKYTGADHYEWTVPGERRVTVLIEPSQIRHIVGVEAFPAGVIPPAQ